MEARAAARRLRRVSRGCAQGRPVPVRGAGPAPVYRAGHPGGEARGRHALRGVGAVDAARTAALRGSAQRGGEHAGEGSAQAEGSGVAASLVVRFFQGIDVLVDPAERLQVAQPAGLERVLRIDARVARGEGGAQVPGFLAPLVEEPAPVAVQLDLRQEVFFLREAPEGNLARVEARNRPASILSGSLTA